VTDAIELAVGAVCLVGAVATWRRRARPASALLGLAGLAAVGHAIWSIAT
jgi:predicted small integral membrane protein